MPGIDRNRRDMEALSTLPNRPNISPSWKQEVNQRVAAHKDRKTSSVAEPKAIAETQSSASRRAAAAAARVAARYANAPSFSELLADEARAAVRAAEAASKAALEAQAAAESLLAGLEAASVAEPAWEVHSSPVQTEKRQKDREAGTDQADTAAAGRGTKGLAAASEGFEIRWEPDLPVRQAEPIAVRATHGNEIPEAGMGSWREPAWPARDGLDGEAIETVEPDQPIHANVIEFPREIVATRKVRPRLAEGPHAAPGAQLSIFEVDPGSISIEPAAAVAADMESAPARTGPEWSGIELDAQPRSEFLETPPTESREQPGTVAAEASGGTLNLELAPMNRRLMAALVNGALIVAAFLLAAWMAVANLKDLPPLREIGVGAVVALAVIGALYHALFFAFAGGNPGARYAGIALCTFDGQSPTRAQRLRRLVALLLSVLPLGLGVMWAVFDEDHLSWHDRLSQTYLRKS